MIQKRSQTVNKIFLVILHNALWIQDLIWIGLIRMRVDNKDSLLLLPLHSALTKWLSFCIPMIKPIVFRCQKQMSEEKWLRLEMGFWITTCLRQNCVFVWLSLPIFDIVILLCWTANFRKKQTIVEFNCVYLLTIKIVKK